MTELASDGGAGESIQRSDNGCSVVQILCDSPTTNPCEIEDLLDPPEGALDLGSDSRLSQDLWRSAPARHRGAGDDALDCCRPVYGNVATGDSDRQTLRRPQYRPSPYR
jgi:hypothetical protein